MAHTTFDANSSSDSRQHGANDDCVRIAQFRCYSIFSLHETRVYISADELFSALHIHKFVVPGLLSFSKIFYS